MNRPFWVWGWRHHVISNNLDIFAHVGIIYSPSFSLSLSLSFSIFLYLYLFVSVSLNLPLYLPLYTSVWLYISTSLVLCMHACMFECMRVVYVCSLRMLCTLVYVCSVCLWCICFKSFLGSILNVQHDTDFRKPESLEQKRGFSIYLRGSWLGSGRWPAELCTH